VWSLSSVNGQNLLCFVGGVIQEGLIGACHELRAGDHKLLTSGYNHLTHCMDQETKVQKHKAAAQQAVKLQAMFLTPAPSLAICFFFSDLGQHRTIPAFSWEHSC
jgi:hypothetical protein